MFRKTLIATAVTLFSACALTACGGATTTTAP